MYEVGVGEFIDAPCAKQQGEPVTRLVEPARSQLRAVEAITMEMASLKLNMTLEADHADKAKVLISKVPATFWSMIQSGGSILPKKIAGDENHPLLTRCSQTDKEKEKEKDKDKDKAERRTTSGTAVANTDKEGEPGAAAAPAIEAAAPGIGIGSVVKIRASKGKFKENYNGFEATILHVLTSDYRVTMLNGPKVGSYVKFSKLQCNIVQEAIAPLEDSQDGANGADGASDEKPAIDNVTEKNEAELEQPAEPPAKKQKIEADPAQKSEGEVLAESLYGRLGEEL